MDGKEDEVLEVGTEGTREKRTGKKMVSGEERERKTAHCPAP